VNILIELSYTSFYIIVSSMQ